MKKILLFISACLAAFSISNAATTTILAEGKDVSITTADAWGGWYGASWNDPAITVGQEAFLEITFNNETASNNEFSIVVQSVAGEDNKGTFTINKAGLVCRIPITLADIQQVAFQNTGAITADYTENVTIKLISDLSYSETSSALTTTGDQLLASELSALNDYDKVVITYNASSDWTATQSGWSLGTINGISLPVTQATNNTLTIYAIDLKTGSDLPFSFWKVSSEETATNASLVSAAVYAIEGAIDTRNSFVLTANAPYNYQSAGIELNLSETVAIDDTIAFTLTNVNVSEDIENLQVFLVESGEENGYAWNVVSNYGVATALENAKASDAAVATVTAKVVIEGAITYPSIVKVIIATTNAPVLGVESINVLFDDQFYDIIAGEEQPTTAINAVESDAFAINGGIAVSAGEIVVYNVVGKVVATASQQFNVNSLAKGVYFITAQEGIIKFVK